MNISLLDNSISKSVGVSITNLSIASVDFLTKTVVISKNVTNVNSFLIQSKLFINNTSLPTLSLKLL